jgi:hypothetical protein
MRVQTSAMALLLVALLAGAAGWWLGRRPDPRLAAQLEQLRTANQQLDSAIQHYQAGGPAAAAQVAHAVGAARQHDTATMTLIDSVLVSVPDTLQPILERIRAAHVATVADYETALDGLKARLTKSDVLLAHSERLRQANLALATAAVKHSGRGLFVVAVGVGATWAGEQVAVGPTVVVGVRVPLPAL